MKDLILLLTGVIVGAMTMGLMSVRSYDKGYEDGCNAKEDDQPAVSARKSVTTLCRMNAAPTASIVGTFSSPVSLGAARLTGATSSGKGTGNVKNRATLGRAER